MAMGYAADINRGANLMAAPPAAYPTFNPGIDRDLMLRIDPQTATRAALRIIPSSLKRIVNGLGHPATI
jgi:hypothetical protein